MSFSKALVLRSRWAAGRPNVALLQKHRHQPTSIPFNNNPLTVASSCSPYSTSSINNSSMNPFSGKWDQYQENKTKKQFRTQMEDLAAVEVWTLGAYKDVLAQTADSWKSKMPLVRSQKEVKDAKESFEIMNSIIEFFGKDSTTEDLIDVGRKERLMVANAAGVTVERINLELQKFDVSHQTHRVIQHIKKEGKEFPESASELQEVARSIGTKFMTKQEKLKIKQQMQGRFAKQMKGK